MFENRRYLVIPTSITGSIDFNQVLESSVETLRLSIDGTKTFVKYPVSVVTASYEEYHEDIENPGTFTTSSIQAGVYGRPSIYDNSYPEYTHSEILDILATEEWTQPIEEI